jgi:flagellar hook-associated protein 3 FlgL
LSPSEKEATAALIAEIRDHVLTLGNSKTGDRYLFGGFNTINPPFQVDGGTGHLLYNGIDMYNPLDPALIAEGNQVIQYEVAHNIKAEVSIPGTQLLGTGEENIYKILDDFYNDLMSDAPATQLSQYVDKLKGVQGNLLTVESEIGGWTNRLELVMTRHDDDQLNYKTIKSKVEEIDQAEAIVKYKMTESIYIASLQISADIIQPTLVDFLD